MTDGITPATRGFPPIPQPKIKLVFDFSMPEESKAAYLEPSKIHMAQNSLIISVNILFMSKVK